MKNLSTANWSPKIEDVWVSGCADRVSQVQGDTTPPCPKKHFTISEVDSKTPPLHVWIFGKLKSNELPYFACYIILPVLHYISFIPRLSALQCLFAYSMHSGGEHLVNFAMCTDVSINVRKWMEDSIVLLCHTAVNQHSEPCTGLWDFFNECSAI